MGQQELILSPQFHPNITIVPSTISESISRSSSSIEVSTVDEFDNLLGTTSSTRSCGADRHSSSSLVSSFGGGHILHSIRKDDYGICRHQGNESTSFVDISLKKPWESIITAFQQSPSVVSSSSMPPAAVGEQEGKLGANGAAAPGQDGRDDKDSNHAADEQLRRIYSSIVDGIKNSSPYSIWKDLLVLVTPTLVPVVHQRQEHQLSKDSTYYHHDTSPPRATMRAITGDYDRDDVSASCHEEQEKKLDQRSEINSVDSDGTYLSLPRKLFTRVAVPVSMLKRKKHDGVRDAFDGKKVVITVNPYRRKEDWVDGFVQELYQN